MATGQYLGELAAALAEKGHEVTVVTGRRAYDNPDRLFPARETWRGVRIIRISSTRFGKKAKWRRAADFASFIVNCCARLVFLPRHDVVMALTTPPLISFIGAWRAKFWRARFCYWVMDMNPDEAVAAGWLRADSFMGKMLERMSRFSFRRADRIIALDRFMRDRIAAKGIAPEKIAVIPPWSQDNDVRFDAAGREQFRKAHGLQDKFVVMYSGNHSPVHPLDTLMQAAERLKDDPSIAFCFIGGGSEFKRVQRWAEDGKNRKRKAKVEFVPAVSTVGTALRLVVGGRRARGHYGERLRRSVHPCKIYNALAVKAPIIYIGPTPSHVTEILDRLGDGYPSIRVAHGEADILAEQIQELRQKTAGGRRPSPTEVTATFSKGVLLPDLIAALEGFRDD